MKVKKLIKSIITKPGMFGIHNVEDYYKFILGYTLGANCTEVGEFMRGFDFFVQEKNKELKHFGYQWYVIIRLHSGINDSHSVSLFISYMQEYMTTRGYTQEDLE
jgi:hypothetical protein